MLKRTALAAAAAAIVIAAGCDKGDTGPQGPAGVDPAASYQTTTPIKHLVVIFQENVSFDHYFGTYPYNADPTTSQPSGLFSSTAKDPGGINNYILTPTLLTANPNAANAANGGPPMNGNGAPVTSGGNVNPFVLPPALAATDDQDHDYPDEQDAFDAGAAGTALMDAFPEFTGNGGDENDNAVASAPAAYNSDGQVMAFFDGRTITAYWNYAQTFAMSDNSFGTDFGPSTPGAINLISGQTNGVTQSNAASSDIVDDGAGGSTLISDADPVGDTCSTSTGGVVHLGGLNIGDLLNAKGVSWGFFEGGFDISANAINPNGTTGCGRTTTSAVTNVTKADYIPHHQPFQYYATTCNPTHTRPSSPLVVGTPADTTPTSTNNCTTATPTANHQYDLNDFYAAVSAGNLPAVSFLKAPGFQDGHAGYSDPLDEQTFVVEVLNFLQSTPEWSSTAVVIAYDDSDGWYDHVTKVVNGSNVASVDQAVCNGTGVAAPALKDYTGDHVVQGRCGYGPRLPLLAISPYSKSNFVDHTLTDQSSISKFVEDNWLAGARIPGSFDAIAGSIQGMFDFTKTGSTLTPALLLDDKKGIPLSSAQ